MLYLLGSQTEAYVEPQVGGPSRKRGLPSGSLGTGVGVSVASKDGKAGVGPSTEVAPPKNKPVLEVAPRKSSPILGVAPRDDSPVVEVDQCPLCQGEKLVKGQECYMCNGR